MDTEQIDQDDGDDDDRDPDSRVVVLLRVPVLISRKTGRQFIPATRLPLWLVNTHLDGDDEGDDVVGGDDEVFKEVVPSLNKDRS